MVERLIENWLTSVGERGYEIPFAQLLASDGHRIIQGPVHHPFEHGKDIISFSANEKLHAYQLKGPDLSSLADFEKIQAQLFALAATAITHPAVTPARLADHVFLVTNSTLTPPVRDRIEKFNISNHQLGLPPIEPIEREQLLAKFVAAHGKYLPQSLPEMRTLIEFYYSEPTSLFPVRSFARYLAEILRSLPENSADSNYRRAIASVTLLTAYAAASWTKAGNHLCVAQAWLTACITVLRFSAAHELHSKHWLNSYTLALESARVALSSLAKEAADAEDLVIPDLVDGFVYPSRALLVTGFLSAYFLSERTLGDVDQSIAKHIRTVLTREVSHLKVVGESGTSALVMTACSLAQLGQIQIAEQLMLTFAETLSIVNQRDSGKALADPYYETEQILLHMLGEESDLDGEDFGGSSYTLHVVIAWLARRLWRQHLAMMWPDITRIQLLEFRPSSPDQYLAAEDDDGELRMWFAEQPQSWAALLEQSRNLNRNELPKILWDHCEMIPYLPLLFPYRLTATLGYAIDVVASDPRPSARTNSTPD